jgi:tetratricopeptide (TPR) repeat protein
MSATTFMGARRLSRPISLLRANVILYLLIACTLLVFWEPLRWAAELLPKYLSGLVPSPIERTLYDKAGKLIAQPWTPYIARGYLERSLVIDPYSEALFGLGQYYFKARDDDRALGHFRAYLEIDPAKLDAYLKIAAVHERNDRLARAKETIERALKYFQEIAEQYQPRTGSQSSTSYGQKAASIFARYEGAIGALSRELARITEKSKPALAVPSPESPP